MGRRRLGRHGEPGTGNRGRGRRRRGVRSRACPPGQAGHPGPLLLGSAGTPSQIQDTIIDLTEPGLHTWLCPANVTSVLVECWGAGAAGAAGSGGGGAGGYGTGTVTVTPGTAYLLSVGAGGLANSGTTSADNAARNGGPSWFGGPGTTGVSDSLVAASGGISPPTGTSTGGTGGDNSGCPRYHALPRRPRRARSRRGRRRGRRLRRPVRTGPARSPRRPRSASARPGAALARAGSVTGSASARAAAATSTAAGAVTAAPALAPRSRAATRAAAGAAVSAARSSSSPRRLPRLPRPRRARPRSTTWGPTGPTAWSS